MPVKIRFKRRAQDEVRKAAAWWAEHRRDTQLIERELTQAFVRLLEHPYLGEPVPNASVPMLRRLYPNVADHATAICRARAV